MKKGSILLVTLLGLWIGAELWIRSRGILDFPLYDVDQGIGYIPKASQEGSYLNRIPWKVNEKNMTAGSWEPNQKPDLLMLGDSIVWGGEEYRHVEKLGPQLQRSLPNWSVWAVGASSWSILNEVEYLRRNHEVVKAADQLVWVLNSEDFGPKSGFVTDKNTPRSKPWNATAYAIRKYLLPKELKRWFRSLINQMSPPALWSPVDPNVPEKELIESLDLFISLGKPTLIFLYPNRAEWIARNEPNSPQMKGYEKVLLRLQSINLPGLQIVDGRNLNPWTEADYRDEMHPTAAGNKKIAEYMARHISEIQNQ